MALGHQMRRHHAERVGDLDLESLQPAAAFGAFPGRFGQFVANHDLLELGIVDHALSAAPPGLGLGGGSGLAASASAAASMSLNSDSWSGTTLSDLQPKKRWLASRTISTSLSRSALTVASSSRNSRSRSAGTRAASAASRASRSLSRESDSTCAKRRAICTAAGISSVLQMGNYPI